MSYFLGYVDVNNDMYVMAGTTSPSGHSFPMNQWTKAASNVKAAVISNEDYDSPCDGYIDMDNNLYIWNSNTTAILFDTNVKQADSSENRMLAYVKMIIHSGWQMHQIQVIKIKWQIMLIMLY